MKGKRAWVTGAGGLIGSWVVAEGARWAEWDVRAMTRDRLDLLDYGAMKAQFREDQPELVFHCAALSKSPACQADPALARRTNVEVTAQLAELAESARFVFLSTDLVFDGGKGWYVEEDAVNPLSVYAETKAEGEALVGKHPRHFLVRTSLNGGCSPTGDRGFNEEMRHAWSGGRILDLFTDEYRCPIAARETAGMLWELALSGENGTYHLAGGERLSRLKIGELVAARCPELNPQWRAGSLRDYEGPPRAPDTSLDCGRLERTLKRSMPGFSQWLREHPDEFF